MAFVEIPKIEVQQDFFLESDLSAGTVICKSPDKLMRLVGMLRENKHIHYVSDGDWSLHDLIAVMLDKLGPSDLYVTTYAIREFAVRQLVLALEANKLLSVNMLVDYRAKIRTPEVYQLAANNMTKIAMTSIHAKVVVLRGMNQSVAILGSSNLTSNPRIEAGVITMDRVASDFHIDWINKTMGNAEIFK